jgi:hypothetical protein
MRFARMDRNRNAGAKPRAFCGQRNLSVLNRGLVRFRTFVPAVFFVNRRRLPFSVTAVKDCSQQDLDLRGS